MQPHRAMLSQLREEPAALICPVTFFAAVDFVRGYDAACQGAVFAGFFEWLKLRGARGGARGWEGLVEGMAFPEILQAADGSRPTDPASERRAIEMLIDLLAEFDDVRERLGLKAILLAFARDRRPR